METPSEFGFPAGREVQHECKAAISVVVVVLLEEIGRSHRMAAEIIAACKLQACGFFEEATQIIVALKRRTKLEVRERVRTELKLRRSADQPPISEKTFLFWCIQPSGLVDLVLFSGVQTEFRFELSLLA